MSIAVLARKTNERIGKKKCAGILNMTGRGGGIGRYHFAGKSQAHSKNCATGPSNVGDCTIQQVTCCGVKPEDKPAPQMSYRNYLNRKTSRSFNLDSKCCLDCCETTGGTNSNSSSDSSKDDQNCFPSAINYRQSTYTSSEITEFRKQATLLKEAAVDMCSTDESTDDQSSSENDETTGYCKDTSDRYNNYICKLGEKGRLGYTRINIFRCPVSKDLKIGKSASEALERVKARAQRNSVIESINTFKDNDIKRFTDCDTVGKSKSWSVSEIRACKGALSNLYFPRPALRPRQTVDGNCKKKGCLPGWHRVGGICQKC